MKAEQRERKRAAIRDAAVPLLAERGVEETSMQDIAAAS